MRRFISLLSLTALILSTAHAADPSSDPYGCSATQPCKIGCCGKNNICGLGPDYCSAENCQNSCDAKSECDPGWGAQWSNKEGCPLNVCCSKYGFCGTTEEFCGSQQVQSPSCSGGNSASQKIIGYYEGWSTTRPCQGMNPEGLDFGAYTHLNYAFAFIDPNTFEVATMQDTDAEFMPRLTALKNYNPTLQVWISIGGWSMNDPDQPTHATFSDLAGSESAQQKFFSSLMSFMSTYGFDGVDIDWEYPVAPERSGQPADFANYVSFLKNLRGALGSNGHNYGLTITLPSSYWYMQNFDIVAIEPIVDWFNVMTYDLHGTWDSTDPYIGAFVNAHTNLTEIDQTMDLLWRNNINPSKVVMGMGFYGRSFTLADSSCSSPGCPFSGGGTPGQCSQSAGTLMFSEIEDIIANEGANVVTDTAAAVKIVTWGGNQWVSYDDADTFKMKMDYANSKCLGGAMVWAASTDDAAGNAIQALTGAAGRTAFSAAAISKAPAPNPGQCVWGECGASCPSGLVPVTSSKGNNGPLGIELGCNQGSRFFCCPADNPPTCEWKGSPKFCGLLSKNQCNKETEVEVAASTDGCWTGHKSLCCNKVGSDSVLSSCEWDGAAPFCSTASGLTLPLAFISPALGGLFSFTSYGCHNSEKPYEQTTGKQGEGGQQSCLANGGFKSYCCSDPSPWKNCKWKTGNVAWQQWKDVLAGPIISAFTSFETDCKTGCDPGQVTVATDGFACRSGTYSYYCCDDPNGAPSPPPVTELSLCYGVPDLPGLNTELEDDPDDPNDPYVYIEVETFDDDCTLPTNQAQRRDLFYAPRPHLRGAGASNQTYIDLTFSDMEPMSPADESIMQIIPIPIDEQHLVRRGTRKSPGMNLCGPNGQAAKLFPITYPGHTGLIKTGKLAWNLANKGVCTAPAAVVAGTNALQRGVKYVTEHVYEKQEFRDPIEGMTQGTTALGNTLTAGVAPFQGLFDDNGLFQQDWPSRDIISLPAVRTYQGNIADSFMGLLGRTSDPGMNNANLDNLQVCYANFNMYKEFIVAGKRFISESKWAALSDPFTRFSALQEVIGTFQYRAQDAVVQSYATTYTNLHTLWGNFAQVASSNGINYDFAGAFQQLVGDNLQAQIQNSRPVFLQYVSGEITFWKSAQAALKYSPTVVQDMLAALNDMQANANNYITLPVDKMLGSS